MRFQNLRRRMRKLAAILLISIILSTSGCICSVPLAYKQGLPLDASLIGLWKIVNVEGTTGDVLISRYSDTEYSIRMGEGKSSTVYRAYPIAVADVRGIQLIEADENYRLKDSE